jgi:hypothetical protein
MIDKKTIRKIESLVQEQPRSIHEIATTLNKNWRTIDRYIQKIVEEYTTISTKIFREGTRGALKIVYTTPTENLSTNTYQKELEEQIFKGRKKEDFSPFDIFQHIPTKQKSIEAITAKDESTKESIEGIKQILQKAKKQVTFLSGNLSFINLTHKKETIIKLLEKLTKKDITIKVICRIDIASIENVRRLLALNHKYGKELIEIKHREQPLRAFIIDGKEFRIKEIKEPTKKGRELQQRHYLFYQSNNKQWNEWLQKIFNKMFNTSLGSEKRITELEKIIYRMKK